MGQKYSDRPEYIKAAVNKRRRKLKRMALEEKGGVCQECGYNRSEAALEFHHMDKNTKEFGIASANKSWEKIKKELQKCVLLCANCHREAHWSGVTDRQGG